MTTTVPPLMFALLATEVFTVSKCATTVQYGLYCNSSLNYFIQNQFCNDKLNFVKIDNDCYHHLNLVLGEHESFLYDKVHFIFLSASHNGEGYQVYFSHIITKIKNSITILLFLLNMLDISLGTSICQELNNFRASPIHPFPKYAQACISLPTLVSIDYK